MHDHKDPFDQGLRHDLMVLSQVSDRRRVLRWIASASLLPVFGCAGTSDSAGGAGTAGAAGAGVSGSDTAGAGSDTSACSKISEETAGPYPGDGSNGPQILTASGVVRGDITTSFGALSGTAQGIPLSVTLKIVNA